MILGGRAIKRAFDEGHWKAFNGLGPLTSDELKIGPNSVDVTLSSLFMWVKPSGRAGEIDVYNEYAISAEIEEHQSLVLKPDDFVLGCTRERFDCSAALPFFSWFPDAKWKQDIDGRSTMGRLGIACHITAGYGDYGFDGHWVLELRNLSEENVRLHAGMRIAQVTFIAVFDPEIYEGAYTNQVGPKAPVLGRERFEVHTRGQKSKPMGLIER